MTLYAIIQAEDTQSVCLCHGLINLRNLYFDFGNRWVRRVRPQARREIHRSQRNSTRNWSWNWEDSSRKECFKLSHELEMVLPTRYVLSVLYFYSKCSKEIVYFCHFNPDTYFLLCPVLDLTLVDLPGLTKNPVGDQDPGIVHKVF